MSTKSVVEIATCLDGCIACNDGSIDWLERANATAPAGEDCGYADFMETVDAIVIGRATVEQVLSVPDCPYGSLPPGVPDSVQLLHATPHDVLERTAEAGHRHLSIDGGRTIQGFLRAVLIYALTITIIPMMLGSGIKLFGDLQADTDLRLVSSKAFPFGFGGSHSAVYHEA